MKTYICIDCECIFEELEAVEVVAPLCGACYRRYEAERADLESQAWQNGQWE